MKSKIIKFITCVTLIVTCIFVGSSSSNVIVDNNSTESFNRVYELTDSNLSSKFEYFNYQQSNNNIIVDVVENIDGVILDNTNLTSEPEQYDVAYSLNYNIDAEVINVIVTTTSNNEVLSIEQLSAYPLIYADGTYDAYVYLSDGTTIYLSEIINEECKNCFFLTMSLSIVSLVSALIATAKVAVVVTAVIAVGAVMYEVKELTREKVEERSRAAELEKTRKNPAYYYPATRKSGKLLISSAPQGLILASKNITKGTDYWSPYDYTAKKLAITACGGYVGPEVDKEKDGYYYHYHLLHRYGGHSFYGTPVGNVY